MKKFIYGVINGERSILETFFIWHYLFSALAIYLYLYYTPIGVLLEIFIFPFSIIVLVILLLIPLSLNGLSLFALWRSATRRSGILSVLAQAYVMFSVCFYAVLLLWGILFNLFDVHI